MTQDKTSPEALLDAFRHHLETRDRSPHSIRAYLSDLCQFATWFTDHTGEPFTLEGVTEYDVHDWRDHLAAKMKPATILSNQALRRILRQARRSGKKRDIALLELLAATGLRASEVAGLRVGDLELNERSGWVTVRVRPAGRGGGREPAHLPPHSGDAVGAGPGGGPGHRRHLPGPRPAGYDGAVFAAQRGGPGGGGGTDRKIESAARIIDFHLNLQYTEDSPLTIRNEKRLGACAEPEAVAKAVVAPWRW